MSKTERITYNEVLESIYRSVEKYLAPSMKRKLMGQWRRIFTYHGLTPRKYLAVIQLGHGHFAVESRTRPGIMHSVDLSEHGCSCEDAQMNKAHCEHQKFIERLIADGLFLPTAAAE